MSWNQHLFALLVLCFNIAAAFATGEGMDLDCDPCIERPDYRIKVIVHGISNDKFWQRVRTSSMQAALDMRVKLDFNLYGKFMQIYYFLCRTKYIMDLPRVYSCIAISHLIAFSPSVSIQTLLIQKSWLKILLLQQLGSIPQML